MGLKRPQSRRSTRKARRPKFVTSLNCHCTICSHGTGRRIVAKRNVSTPCLACCCPDMGPGGGSSRSGTSPHPASPCCCPAIGPGGGSSQRGTSPHPASPCCSPKWTMSIAKVVFLTFTKNMTTQSGLEERANPIQQKMVPDHDKAETAENAPEQGACRTSCSCTR